MCGKHVSGFFYMWSGMLDEYMRGENMEIDGRTIGEVDEKIVMGTLLSDLDKGIDDVEANRMHAVDDAFQIIRERMDEEL